MVTSSSRLVFPNNATNFNSLQISAFLCSPHLETSCAPEENDFTSTEANKAWTIVGDEDNDVAAKAAKSSEVDEDDYYNTEYDTASTPTATEDYEYTETTDYYDYKIDYAKYDGTFSGRS